MAAPYLDLHPLLPRPGDQGRRDWAERMRLGFGGLYLVTAGVHIGMVTADTAVYRHFADGALPPVRTAWADVFMAAPAAWGLAVAAGELAIGLLLLAGRRRTTRAGFAGAIAFHLALVLFGWGFLVYVIPALALLVPASLHGRTHGH